MEAAKSQWEKYCRDTPMFSWEGKCVKARLVDAHDGDTCRVVFRIEDTMPTFKQFVLRLDGIDSPEMNSHDPLEVAAAVKARNRLLSLLAPTLFDADEQYSKQEILRLLKDHVVLVYLALGKYDKYGRILCQMFPEKDLPDKKSANHALIDEGLVHHYDGGRKQPWGFS